MNPLTDCEKERRHRAAMRGLEEQRNELLDISDNGGKLSHGMRARLTWVETELEIRERNWVLTRPKNPRLVAALELIAEIDNGPK